MTHEYTILTGGLVLGGAEGCTPSTAVAWAADTVLAVGSDAEVLAISRGDSRVVALHGALVAPRGPSGSLEPGDPADLAILDPGTRTVMAEVRHGRLVEGGLPGLALA